MPGQRSWSASAYSATVLAPVSGILILIGFALMLLTFILASRETQRPWAFFQTDGSVFVASRRSTQLMNVGIAISAAVLAAGTFGASYPMHGTHLGALSWIAIALVNALVAVTNRTARERLLIRPDGVEVRGQLSNAVVTWEQLSDPFALADAGLRGPSIPQRGMSPRGFRLRADRLTVPPEWILETIAYYRDNPDQRALIGSQHELVRISPIPA
jgi:hypothetical protein